MKNHFSISTILFVSVVLAKKFNLSLYLLIFWKFEGFGQLMNFDGVILVYPSVGKEKGLKTLEAPK